MTRNPRSSGKRRTPHQVALDGEKWAKEYAAGASIRTIAIGAERSYGTVHGTLTMAGVQLRSRGGLQQSK